MMDNVAMHIGIQLTLMLLVNGLGAAISAEYDVINKIGVTHNVAKVHITNEICKCVLGVAVGDISVSHSHPLSRPSDSLCSFPRSTQGVTRRAALTGVSLSHTLVRGIRACTGFK